MNSKDDKSINNNKPIPDKEKKGVRVNIGFVFQVEVKEVVSWKRFKILILPSVSAILLLLYSGLDIDVEKIIALLKSMRD